MGPGDVGNILNIMTEDTREIRVEKNVKRGSTLNIISLYIKASIISVARFMTIIQKQNVDLSTVFWRLEHQIIGALLMEEWEANPFSTLGFIVSVVVKI